MIKEVWMPCPRFYKRQSTYIDHEVVEMIRAASDGARASAQALA